ncbi:MAG: hypothetical protein IJG38_08125 [Thermoguttaceae bacterium]|nr:hypothetical protein [Thermoguttaceae bacterium]
MKSDQEAETIEQGAKKGSGIVPGNIPQNVSMQDGNLDNSELQDSEKPIPQVPEIQGLLQNKKTSCYEKQDVQEIKKWAVQDLIQEGLSPLKSKELCNSLFEQLQEKLQGCSKKGLILSLFDLMDSDEQSALLDALQARVQSAEEMTR